MTKKKKADVTLKPLKQPLPAWAYVWISLAGFLLGIGLLFLYIFKAPGNPTKLVIVLKKEIEQ